MKNYKEILKAIINESSTAEKNLNEARTNEEATEIATEKMSKMREGVIADVLSTAAIKYRNKVYGRGWPFERVFNEREKERYKELVDKKLK